MTTNTDWIEWAGGECPVPGDTRVEIETREGEIYGPARASFWGMVFDWWKHEESTLNGHDCDIIAYRIVKP